jgi:hypothetical protein
MPELTWLASGGKAGLKASKVKFLGNRHIILFPDLSKPEDRDNCYLLWKDTAKELRKSIPAISIKVSDYLETRATDEEKSEGLDIADYFLKWEWDNEGNGENEASHKPFFSGNRIPNEGNEENDQSQKPFFSGPWMKLNESYESSDLSKAILEKRIQAQLLGGRRRNCYWYETKLEITKFRWQRNEQIRNFLENIGKSTVTPDFP